MGAADQIAVGTIRGDHRREDDEAGVGEQPSHLADAADVLGSVRRREAEVGVEPVAKVVAVEHVGGAAQRQ